jgi:fatty acid-binding protein DegV
LVPVKKARGRKAALDILREKIKDLIDPSMCDIAAIVHANAKDDAEYLASYIKKDYNLDVLVNYIGPVIGSHVGTGTLAVLFCGKER